MNAIISTRNLQWLKASHSFVGEISELPNQRIPLARVFQDSCDEGFTLVSHVTGAELDFFLDNVLKKDGDTLSWTFRPVQRGVPVESVVIFND